MTDQIPRLLVIMGSGETSPTMSKLHRELFARLDRTATGLILDTPFGFQENADDIAARAIEYFRESVNRSVSVASFRSAAEIGSIDHETMLARLAEAQWVFSGPGSPSYAVDQWRGSQVPARLADRLRDGGCVVFASAAAATLGPVTLPVYEIYKVGAPPHWLEGLDLLSIAGLSAAVIPHYNNAEGGNHDTRYCYMGERRLRMLEDQLPDDVFVLGVDEHTALVLDLAAGSATVAGLGGVTVRRRTGSTRVESGQTMSVHCLASLAAGHETDGEPAGPVERAAEPIPARSPLLEDLARTATTFSDALAAQDARAAAAAVLHLDDLVVDWSRDTLQSDELDRGRAALRSMVVRLGEAAQMGLRNERDVLGPFVEALLEARQSARAGSRWQEADAIRDRLLAAGVEVRDGPEGTDWQVG